MNLRSLSARPFALAALAISSLQGPLSGQTSLNYQEPPKAIVDLIDARHAPHVEVSPADSSGRRWMMIGYPSLLPSISDLAQPELRLAGLRFNPKTNGPSRGGYLTSLGLQALPDGKEVPVTGLPRDAKIRFTVWAPDARHLAFVNISDAPGGAGMSLWVVDVASAEAHRIPGVALNGLFGDPYGWMPDSQRLVCRTVPDGRPVAPARSEVPTGPVVQENLGRVTPGATFEDLLKSPEDERIFDYYATSQVRIAGLDGSVSPVGAPGVVSSADASPDGNYVLINELHHPYSYMLPSWAFPVRVSVLDLRSGAARQLVDKPLQDTIPPLHDAVAPGPREFQWRSDAPASVCYMEAADGGDPRKDVPVRDRVFLLDAPFDGAPRMLAELPLRVGDISWSSDRLALLGEYRWRDRKRIILAVAPGGGAAPFTVFEGSYEDAYHDPGWPFKEMNASGKEVLVVTPDASTVYFGGEGASPGGDMPFVSAVNVGTGAMKRLWQSAPPIYEYASAVLDAVGPVLLVGRESQEMNPNFFVRNVAANSIAQVTFFPNPFGSSPVPRKQVLKYKRADGVDLTADLYVPPGYKPADGPLPTLMEAYPTEFKTRDAAGQTQGSPCRFPYISWGSPMPFVTQGYAVLEHATIPIVGEGKAEPNDTYVEQLVAGAKAAIDEGVRLGVVDRNRVAVMGHSYGAFMTANLLAHSNLFRAGIARSGAYNRTLTPFGFQNEERNYWQAPEVYFQMSPFSFADKIKTPLLLIHGEADNNSGTFPIQSERLFSAIKGQGGTVRFVLLPLESHGYAARESVLHMFWEMNTWLTTYVKNAPAPAPAPAAKP
jgi:dipeptidyl aminopeptidase/acylaminoacyl peptidase